jgi:hypothetical protein
MAISRKSCRAGIQCGSAEAHPGAYGTVPRHETATPNEYFIIENHRQFGLDGHLPSSGLAVYRYDC